MSTEKIKSGDVAPLFTAKSSDGVEFVLENELHNNNILLYFYPKDDTPGCTIEANEFTAKASEFAKFGIKIVGVSKDDLKCHQKFIEKYNLKITLLADESLEICNKYGTFGEKIRFGVKYKGINRTTFLIGKSGKIEKTWNNVKAEGHADQVLKFCLQKDSL